MTKVERKAKRRIRKLAKKWMSPLGLRWWERIVFVYSTDHDSFKKDGDGEVVMTVSASWQYKTAVITVNCHLCAQMSKERLESIFLHEMAHILLDELDVHNDHEERVCTNLSQVFRWLWLAGAEKLD